MISILYRENILILCLSKDSYGSDPPKKVCRVLRGRWFLFSAKALTPYDEQTDEAIEEAYQRIIAQAAAKSLNGRLGENAILTIFKMLG